MTAVGPIHLVDRGVVDEESGVFGNAVLLASEPK